MVSTFISKTLIDADTLYNFIVPNTVLNNIYLINAFNYSNLISDSSRLVRFFVLPSNIDSLGVFAWGWNQYSQLEIPKGLNNVIQVEASNYYYNIVLKRDGTVVGWGYDVVYNPITPAPDGLNNVVQIAAGNDHFLALKGDGTVVGWGIGDFGQINIPAGLNNVVQVVGGSNHSLALKADGTVVTWGSGIYGLDTFPRRLKNVVQISAKSYASIALKGDGTVVAGGSNISGQNNIPAGLNNVIQIVSGDRFSLALKGDGTVVAWGDNLYRQTNIPVGLNNVVQISAGGYHNLVLKKDTTLVAWGSNSDGQSTIPAGLNLKNVEQISAGGTHNLVLNKISIQTVANTGGIISPSIFAKNGNNYRITYQPNAGYFIDSVFINGVLNTDSLTGYTFNGIYKNQSVRVVFIPVGTPSKPRNLIAIAGNRKAKLHFLTPTRLGGFKIIKYIAKVEGTNIQDSSTNNNITITGLTNLQSYNISVKAINNEGFVSDTAIVNNIIPADYTEIISTNRSIYKMGDTIQLRGNGIKTVKLKSIAIKDSFLVSNFISKTAINVDTLYNFIVPNTVKSNVYAISIFSYSNRLSDSVLLVRFAANYIDSVEIIGWGDNTNGQTNIPKDLNNLVQIATGGYHGLALKADGTVVAWGNNDNGQTIIPTGLNNVVQIAGGDRFSLALKGDGTVVGWGSNIINQINIPTGLKNVVQIAGGESHSLALKADGTVVGWGKNDFGQINIPADLKNVVQITCGARHSLVLKGDSTVVAWGDTNNRRKVITIPAGLNNVVQISSGFGSNLALKRDGTVVGWGNNYNGETTIPAGLNNVAQVVTGFKYSLVLKKDGTMVAWGENYYGQTNIPAILNNGVQIVGGAGSKFSLAFNKLTIQTVANTGGTISPPILVNNKEKYRITYQPNEWIFIDSIFINGVLNRDSLTGYTFSNIYQYQTIRVVFTAINTPTKPRNATAIGGNKIAILTFLPPANLGSRSIVKYISKIEGTNQQDTAINSPIIITGLTNYQTYNISVKAINNEGYVSDTALVRNIIPIGTTEIISINRPTYKKGDTIQLRGNMIKTLKLKSVVTKDSFEVSNFISKNTINTDTLYRFIVPNTVKNEVYLIHAFSYSNQISDSSRLVRFFVLPSNIDSLGVIGWGFNGYGQTTIPAGLNNVVQITAGRYHSLSLKGDGTVVAWGDNGYGQTNIPVGLNNVTQIASGQYHSLALKGDGTVVAWGNNFNEKTIIPDGLNNVVQIACGGSHNLALKGDGTVISWGFNGFGATTIPAGLNYVVQIAGGGGHSLALKADGTIVAWGYNSDGQTTIPAGLNNVVQIAGGSIHSLALKGDSTVVAWGNNSDGQITIPAGLNNVVQIAVGGNHSLALKADGTLVAWGGWGNNYFGEISIPAGLNNVVQIAGGTNYNLAQNKLSIQTVANTGGIISPTIFVKNGDNYRITYQANAGYFVDSIFINGVLNRDSLNGYTFNNIYQYQTIRVVYNAYSAPTKPRNVIAIGGNKKAILTFLPPANFGSKNIIKYIANVDGIDLNDSNTNSPIIIYGLTNLQTYNISVKAINNEGLVSDTVFVTNIIPLEITELISTNQPTYKMGDTVQLRGNGIKTLKLKSISTKDSFEVSDFISKTTIKSDTVYKFIVPNTVKNDVYLIHAFDYLDQISDSIRLVRFFVLPTNIDSVGVIGWGDNEFGQTSIPAGLNSVVQIAGGTNHSLALKRDGTVVAWGNNSVGQTSIPAGLNNVVQIAGGTNFSLALKGDGTVVAWGNNEDGQTNIPAGLNSVVQIMAGSNHSLALKADGTIVGWGGSGDGLTNIPVGLNKVVQIAGGIYHILALKRDGTIVAWGDTSNGKTNIPAGLNNVVQIFGGNNYNLILKGDSTVIAWGDNFYGQTSIPDSLNNVVQIAGGNNYSLFLKGDGSVVALGDNSNGQTSIPAGLNNVVQIAGGTNHSLALNKLYIQTVANTGGIISPTIFVKNGDSNRITYQANAGYFVDSVFINGVLNNDSLTGYTFNNMYQYQTIRVVFNAYSAPTKPRNVTAIGGNKKAILTFLPPANFGSRNILKYIAKIEGTDIQDSNTNSPIIITGLTNLQTYNISLKAINNEGLESDTILINNIIPIEIIEIISTNQPTYKMRDTIEVRGNSIKTLKFKSLATRNSFEVSNFISKTNINSDTLYNFIVPNTVKNNVYLINAVGYSNQISDSIRLVRFFVLPTNIDSLFVTGWGYNKYGETTIPAGLNNVAQIAGGKNHSLALKGDGTVVAWGENSYRQTTIPTGLNNVVQIASGLNHSLALKGDGTVVAWGNNSNGQTNIPAGLNNVIQIAGGSNHSIALKGDGTVIAWGNNTNGQTTIPVGLNKVVQIAGGWGHSLALKGDGTVVAWGYNENGQTNIPIALNNVIQIAGGNNFNTSLKGDGTIVAWGDNNNEQTNIPLGLNNVIQIASGDFFTLSLKKDGTVVAWGNNSDGQTTIPAGLKNVVQVAGGSNHSLALFKGFKVNTSVNIGGTISASKIVFVNTNFRVTYSAINNDLSIDSIYINGVYDSAITKDSINGYTFTNINSNKSIKLVYKIPKYTITAISGDNGSISSQGVTTVNYGSRPAYIIIPNIGYEIENLFVNGIKINNINIYTFDSVKSNQTIVVTFKIQTFTIISSAGAGGNITPQGTTVLNYGATPTFTITPNSGNVIDSLIINSKKINNVNIYTFDSVKSNQTIRVTFKSNIVCPSTKVTPTIVRVGNTLQSDINTFAKHRWYLDGTKKDSTIANSYTPQTAGVYTLLGLDANGCESNLSKKYYYSQTCITPTGRLGNGASIEGNIIENATQIVVKWCTDIIKNDLTIQVIDISGVRVLEHKVASNIGTLILNKQIIPAKKYIIKVIDNNGEVLQISDVINN
ncbi:MAG: hypothetical protein ORN58_00660 [Sediminibacterium sp.]|nr:hypothetical protein [Sediminibacterium sp.]